MALAEPCLDDPSAEKPEGEVGPNTLISENKYSREESIHYGRLFDLAEPNDEGLVSGSQTAALLQRSGLPLGVLHQIWELVEDKRVGQLDANEFFSALRLVAHVQAGAVLSQDLLGVAPSMLPNLDASGSPPWRLHEAGREAPRSTYFGSPDVKASPSGSSSWGVVTPRWALTQSDSQHYAQLFLEADDDGDGFVEGPQAKALFERSGLPPTTLAIAWEHADADGDGRLSFHEFLVMLHLITCCRNGCPMPPLEEGLPPELSAVLSESLGSPRELAFADGEASPPTYEMSPRELSMASPNKVESPSASSSSLGSPLAQQADWWASPSLAGAPSADAWVEQEAEDERKKERQRRLEKQRQKEEETRKEYRRRLEERRRREEQESWLRAERARELRQAEDEKRRNEEEQRREEERRLALEDEERRQLHEERRREAEQRRRQDEAERIRLEEEEQFRKEEERRRHEEEDRLREIEKNRRRKEEERRSEEERVRKDTDNGVERLEAIAADDRSLVERLTTTIDDVASEVMAIRDEKDRVQQQIESQTKAKEALQIEKAQLAEQLQLSEKQLRSLRNDRWVEARESVVKQTAGRERMAEEIVFLQRIVEEGKKKP